MARLVVRKLEATSKRLAEVEKELRELKEAKATAKPAAAKPASAPKPAASKLKRPVKRAPAAAVRKPARVR